MRTEEVKGSALVITMLLLVVLTALGIYAVGLSTSGIEFVSGEERERAARNAAEAGAWYGIDRLPFPPAESRLLLPNGAGYEVSVSSAGTEPLPGYDEGWMRATFRIRSTGIAPRAERVRRVTEAEVAFGPVPAGTGYLRDGIPSPLSRSIPILVGPPSPWYLDSRNQTARNAFASRYAGRKPLRLLSAHDGTLRASFSEESAWAFLPRFVNGVDAVAGERAESLPAFTEGALAVADIRRQAASGGAKDSGWRTVAVAGAGPRGRGVFALDITDPASPGYPSPMWEVAKGEVPILGQVLSSPAIGKVRTTAGRLDAPGETVDRWVVVLGAGKAIRSGRPDSSDEGRGILVLEAASGKVQQVLTHPDMGEVVASPAVSTDREGYIERVYVGDLSGNLWRAVVNDAGRFDIGGGPFFSVTRGDIARSIHGKCAIVPGEGEFPGLWVYFGTGDIENTPDLPTGGVFAVHDRAERGLEGVEKSPAATERALVDATRFFERINDQAALFPSMEGAAHRGWHAILPSKGERILSGPRIFFSNIFLTTFQQGRKASEENGSMRVYGFGITPGKNLGNPALSDPVGSGAGIEEPVFTSSRVRSLRSGGIWSGPLISIGSGGTANLSVRPGEGEAKLFLVPAPLRMKSVGYWKNVEP